MQIHLINSLYHTCCTRTEHDQKHPSERTQYIPSLTHLKEMDTLPRISCNISAKEFHEKYEHERRPVMLEGCDKDWPARENWVNVEKLYHRFDNSSKWRAQIHTGDTLEDDVLWSTFVDTTQTNEQYYIFDQLDHPAGKLVENDYITPKPFKESDVYRHFDKFPEDYGTLRWFCVGKKGTGTMPHMDPVMTDAWNSLVSGHKWWIIYPSELEASEPVECQSDCSIDSPQPYDWYANVGVNAARTMYQNEQKPYHVLQRPGETIYVPYGRVHSVFNVDDTIAVTANFGSISNLPNVWHTILEENPKFWTKLYYTVFNKHQRASVRNLDSWGTY